MSRKRGKQGRCGWCGRRAWILTGFTCMDCLLVHEHRKEG